MTRKFGGGTKYQGRLSQHPGCIVPPTPKILVAQASGLWRTGWKPVPLTSKGGRPSLAAQQRRARRPALPAICKNPDEKMSNRRPRLFFNGAGRNPPALGAVPTLDNFQWNIASRWRETYLWILKPGKSR